jgi:hypothetical protein
VPANRDYHHLSHSETILNDFAKVWRPVTTSQLVPGRFLPGENFFLAGIGVGAAAVVLLGSKRIDQLRRVYQKGVLNTQGEPRLGCSAALTERLRPLYH